MRRMSPTAWRGAAIGAAAAVLILAGLGRADLFNPDEPREAEIAREMWAAGDLLVPRLNGQPFLEKPPLHYWLVSAAFRAAGGPSETAARSLPALAGVLGVILTWWFGRRLVGETAAAVGALVLATSFEYWWVARRCMIDVPLTLMVLVACGALHRGTTQDGRKRFGWIVLGFGAAAAAVLLKGLVGLGVPLLAVAAFLLLRRDPGGLLRHGIVPGAIAALAPAAVWAWALWRRLGDGALRELAWVNNVQRLIGGADGKGHEQPFAYYGRELPLDFAPWSLVLPFAVVAAWRFLRRPGGPLPGAAGAPGPGAACGTTGATPAARRLAAPERAGVLFLMCWFAVPFLLLSLASTKRSTYLLPIYPAAALLCGWLAAGEDDDRRALARPALWILFPGVLAMAAAVFLAMLRVRPFDWLAPTVMAALLAPPGLAAWRALLARRTAQAALLGAALTAVLCVGLCVGIVPRVVERYASHRPAGAALARLVEAGDRIALHDFGQGMLGEVLFYAGRTFPNLRSVEDLEAHLSGPRPAVGPRPMALMLESRHAALAPRLRVPTIVARRFAHPAPPVGHPSDSLVLVVPWGEIGDNGRRRAPGRPPA
jgi:4-amino-4-deoxy-L-arabinose transferase-like glycosyltransferase